MQATVPLGYVPCNVKLYTRGGQTTALLTRVVFVYSDVNVEVCDLLCDKLSFVADRRVQMRDFGL